MAGGRERKLWGFLFFLLENNLKQFYSSWGILLLSSLLPILHFFFFYLRNWSSEVIINSSCKDVFHRRASDTWGIFALFPDLTKL